MTKISNFTHSTILPANRQGSGQKFQFSNATTGFTLLELLVVMTVFLIVGSMLGSIIFTHIRSVDKTNVLTTVRQNGNYVISQMSKDIRNARDFTPNSSNTCLGLEFYDQTIKYYRCTGNTTTNNTIEAATSCTTTGSPLFDTNIAVIPPANDPLDPNKYCKFTLTGNSKVSIHFRLQQNGSASIGNPVVLDFDTSITRRNY